MNEVGNLEFDPTPPERDGARNHGHVPTSIATFSSYLAALKNLQFDNTIKALDSFGVNPSAKIFFHGIKYTTDVALGQIDNGSFLEKTFFNVVVPGAASAALAIMFPLSSPIAATIAYTAVSNLYSDILKGYLQSNELSFSDNLQAIGFEAISLKLLETVFDKLQDIPADIADRLDWEESLVESLRELLAEGFDETVDIDALIERFRLELTDLDPAELSGEEEQDASEPPEQDDTPSDSEDTGGSSSGSGGDIGAGDFTLAFYLQSINIPPQIELSYNIGTTPWPELHDRVLIHESRIMEGTSFSERIYGDDGLAVEIDGLSGPDMLFGSNYADVLFGGFGNDYIEGNSGDDRIIGGPGFDTIYAEGGNDIIKGELSGDKIDGGDDYDDIVIYSDIVEDIEIWLSGDATELGAWDVAGFARMSSGDLYVDQIIWVENAVAGRGDDYLRGHAGDNKLAGGPGSDFLEGLGGADILIGGEGNDVLDGGSGENRLFGGAGDDVLFSQIGGDIMDGGLGADTFVFASIDDEWNTLAVDDQDTIYLSNLLSDVSYGDAQEAIESGDLVLAPLDDFPEATEIRVRAGDDLNHHTIAVVVNMRPEDGLSDLIVVGDHSG